VIAVKNVTVVNRPKLSGSICPKKVLEVIVKQKMELQEQDFVILKHANRTVLVNGVTSVLAAMTVTEEHNRQYLLLLITTQNKARYVQVKKLNNVMEVYVQIIEDSRGQPRVEKHAKLGIHKHHRDISTHLKRSKDLD